MPCFLTGVRWLSMLCAAILAAGCGGGDELEKHDLSGAVTFDGQPVVYGSIEFVPDQSQNNSGPQGYAEIVDGQYDTSSDGGAVVEGPHKVRITAYRERPPELEGVDEANPPASPEPLFVGYTVDADLQPPTQDFEVPASAAGFNLYEAASGSRRGNEP